MNTYTVENRLEAVCTDTAYSQTLQMAADYDGDGNRVYQMNYNPDKDEDFSDYYCTYNSCDYKGTGIRLRAEGEVSPAERELLSLITASGAITDSSYELIEYINDVNREYAEVLVEQNINGTPDTAYVYGAAIGAGSDHLSLDHFDSTGYYLHDPRGSVTGITNEEGQIYQSYRYSVFGEITFGAPRYENEYTYNGESYNPNIKSQYLRARYYCVVTADFLTEDSYLGNIADPLTLNRYNYCLGSPLNYVDPSGNREYGDKIKDFLNSLFGNNNNDTTDDEPSVLYSLAKPIPTPRPTQVPLILPEGVEPYEQGLFPNAGIDYFFEANWRQPEQDISQLTPTPTQTPIQEQMQVGIENSNIQVCENLYAKFTMENYEELLAFEGENKNYEGFVAVAYLILNRAIRDNMTITKVGESGAFSAYNPDYDINQINDEVKRAAEDVLTGNVENPIGDAYYFFGRIKGYDFWVEPEVCSYVKIVRGNVFYSIDDYGKVHNKYPFSDFDPEKQLVLYNVSLEGGKWIYDGLIIENGKVVVDRNVEDEAK